MIEKNKLFILIINILLSVFTIALIITSTHSISLSKLFSVMLLIDSIILCFYTRKNKVLFIIFFILLYCNYSIVFSRYLIWNTTRSISNFYIDNISSNELSLGIMCLFLFFSILTMFFSIYRIREWHSTKSSYNSTINNIISTILLIILVVIFIFGFEWKYGERGSTTAVFEYSIIFYIFLLYFNHSSRFLKICEYLISILFIIVPIYFGERISALHYLFAIYLFKFSDKIKIYQLIIVTLIGIVLMNFISIYRGNYNIADVSFGDAINKTFSSYITFDGCDYAYYCSMTILKTKEFTSLTDTFYLFSQFLKSIVLGGSIKFSELSEYSAQYFSHWNGSYTPINMYFYMNIFGIISFALFLCFLIYYLSKNSKLCLILIFISVVTFRWYNYTPRNLFRSTLIFVLIYIIIFAICTLLNRGNKEATYEFEKV